MQGSRAFSRTTADTPGAAKFDLNPEVRPRPSPSLRAELRLQRPPLLGHDCSPPPLPKALNSPAVCIAQRPILTYETDGPEVADHEYSTEEEMVGVRRPPPPPPAAQPARRRCAPP